VELYNNERPHMSIGNLYPNQVHENNLKKEKLWKNLGAKLAKSNKYLLIMLIKTISFSKNNYFG